MATVHRQATPYETDADIVRTAQRLFGPRIASAIAAGSWDVVRFERSSGDTAPGQPSVHRLRDALAIAELLLDVEAEETVRSWFAGKNPILDDRAPAIVISENPEQVRLAARDLIAHG